MPKDCQDLGGIYLRTLVPYLDVQGFPIRGDLEERKTNPHLPKPRFQPGKDIWVFAGLFKSQNLALECPKCQMPNCGVHVHVPEDETAMKSFAGVVLSQGKIWFDSFGKFMYYTYDLDMSKGAYEKTKILNCPETLIHLMSRRTFLGDPEEPAVTGPGGTGPMGARGSLGPGISRAFLGP